MPEQKTEIRNNIADCQKNGVCKYLMDLEEEWENIDFSQSMSLSYKDFEDKDATMSIGAGKVGSLGDGVRTNGQKQGIIMTSVLFCRHGGFIYPVTSGQKNRTEGFQFTLEQLRACGWVSVTEEELRKLNAEMQKFGVISKESAYMMLATMLGESGCTETLEGGEKLRIALENAVSEEEKDEIWKQYKDDLEQKGIVVGNYEWWERGAGYMQITKQALQEQFLNYMEDPFDGKDKATYIGDNYPIESAVWYWTNLEMTKEGNLNAYVKENGAYEGVFLITQYFVNGYVSGIDGTLRGIKEGAEYKIEGGKLISNGKEFRLPNGWASRYPHWQKVEECMKNEE